MENDLSGNSVSRSQFTYKLKTLSSISNDCKYAPFSKPAWKIPSIPFSPRPGKDVSPSPLERRRKRAKDSILDRERRNRVFPRSAPILWNNRERERERGGEEWNGLGGMGRRRPCINKTLRFLRTMYRCSVYIIFFDVDM